MESKITFYPGVLATDVGGVTGTLSGTLDAAGENPQEPSALSEVSIVIGRGVDSPAGFTCQ